MVCAPVRRDNSRSLDLYHDIQCRPFTYRNSFAKDWVSVNCGTNDYCSLNRSGAEFIQTLFIYIQSYSHMLDLLIYLALATFSFKL